MRRSGGFLGPRSTENKLFLHDFRDLAISAYRRSKTAQEAPKRAPRRPKRAPRRPQRPPGRPKRAPGRSQEAPGTAQEGPRTAPRGGPEGEPERTFRAFGPKRPPRGPKRPLGSPQKAPKGPQEAPRRPPRGPQTPPQRPPRALRRKTPRKVHEDSDPQSKHGGGMGRKPFDSWHTRRVTTFDAARHFDKLPGSGR